MTPTQNLFVTKFVECKSTLARTSVVFRENIELTRTRSLQVSPRAGSSTAVKT